MTLILKFRQTNEVSLCFAIFKLNSTNAYKYTTNANLTPVCMYVCMYVCVYVYIYIYIYIYILIK